MPILLPRKMKSEEDQEPVEEQEAKEFPYKEEDSEASALQTLTDSVNKLVAQAPSQDNLEIISKINEVLDNQQKIMEQLSKIYR